MWLTKCYVLLITQLVVGLSQAQLQAQLSEIGAAKQSSDASLGVAQSQVYTISASYDDEFGLLVGQ